MPHLSARAGLVFAVQMQLGIGVREQLPFKVSIVEEAGKTRLVLDVAHNAT